MLAENSCGETAETSEGTRACRENSSGLHGYRAKLGQEMLATSYPSLARKVGPSQQIWGMTLRADGGMCCERVVHSAQLQSGM